MSLEDQNDPCYIIPVGPGKDVALVGDFPLSDEEGEQFMRVLLAMWPALYGERVAPRERQLSASAPDEPRASAPAVSAPQPRSSWEPVASTDEETGAKIEEAPDDAYVVWAKIANKLDAHEIDIFRCRKKMSSARSVQAMMMTKYPELRVKITSEPKGLGLIEVSRTAA